MDGISAYVSALLIALIVSHAIKSLSTIIRDRRKISMMEFFASGGMPSSHAASSLAVWMVVLLRDGWGSGLFGIVTLLSLIVCYDAVNVRQAVGEQGKAITGIIENSGIDIKPPRVSNGHTLLEVVAGALLGMTVGVVVFLATK